MKLSAGAAAMAAMGGAAANAQAAGAQTSTKPNLLLLMTDQHRGDCLGIDGHPVVQTPNYDRIAREGVHFACGYSSTPTCTPARAGLLTGLKPWNHGMIGYAKVAEKYDFEMPQALSDAGYYTLGIGKMHWSPQRTLHGFHRTILDESSREETIDFRSDYKSWFYSQAPNREIDETGIGWNDYRAAVYTLPEELHPTRWTGDTAVSFIENYNRPEPFYLKVSFSRPHSPYDAPERFAAMYRDADIPERWVGDWASRYEERSDDSFNIWHGNMGPEQARESRIGYYGNVTFLDEQYGRILQALEKRGMLDNTLILVVADHGDMLGDHHMWRKSYAYEPSARIPYLMRWPKNVDIPRGQKSDAPVELRDVFATFLDAAGAPGEDRIDGRSLLGLMSGRLKNWRPYIDLEHDICYNEVNHWSALTDGKTKYIFHAFDGEEQLFDLVNDPGEERDLAKDSGHKATLGEWRDRMVAELNERGEEWVKDGQLVLRPQSIKYSPNYPKAPEA